MKLGRIVLVCLLAGGLVLATSVDITDYQIPFDFKKFMLTWGSVSILLLLISSLLFKRREQTEVPTLDGD